MAVSSPYFVSGATGQAYLSPTAYGAFGGATPPLTFNQPLVGNLLSAFGRQNSADRQRMGQGYQSLIGGIQGLTGNLLGQIDQLGSQRRTQIDQAFNTQSNNAVARTLDRGVGGSFIANAGRGAERDRQLSLNGLNDQLLSQKIGVQNQLGQLGFNALEKSFQPQADSSLLLNLLNSIGRGGEGLNATLMNQFGSGGFNRLF